MCAGGDSEEKIDWPSTEAVVEDNDVDDAFEFIGNGMAIDERGELSGV